MKAKACTRCRQSKLRCDFDAESPNACTRCRSIGKACVVDRNFRHTSKSRRVLELETELKRIRQERPETVESASLSNSLLAQVQSAQPQPSQRQPIPTGTNVPTSQCLQNKSIGRVHLTAGQVTEAFRVFFVQCHPYLDFSIPTSPETVYQKCPLLFWVICAVTSSTSTMLTLQTEIEAMVGPLVVNPPRSVEVVQALLVLCMWPFPFYSTLSDPSLCYCGIATSIGLQIGLHRPSLSQEFSSRKQVLDVGDHERKTTWMAVYVVNQMQAGRLGVPMSIQADFTFLDALETPNISPILVALCRISRLTIQLTTTIGANAQNLSGLLEPATRVDMVRFFSMELDSLRRRHFPEMPPAVEIAFLTSKLHLWSFILHDDIPCSQDVIEFIYQAEKDATTLIQLASQKNLARCPFHVARSVLYSAVVLVKILASAYPSQPQVLLDQIHLASRTLSSAVRVPDDHAARWSRHLQELMTLRDTKRTPSIRSRMAASIMYDTIRIMKENMEAAPGEVLPTLGLDGAPAPTWMELENGPDMIDLDGINWDDLGGLL